MNLLPYIPVHTLDFPLPPLSLTPNLLPLVKPELNEIVDLISNHILTPYTGKFHDLENRSPRPILNPFFELSALLLNPSSYFEEFTRINRISKFRFKHDKRFNPFLYVPQVNSSTPLELAVSLAHIGIIQLKTTISIRTFNDILTCLCEFSLAHKLFFTPEKLRSILQDLASNTRFNSKLSNSQILPGIIKDLIFVHCRSMELELTPFPYHDISQASLAPQIFTHFFTFLLKTPPKFYLEENATVLGNWLRMQHPPAPFDAVINAVNAKILIPSPFYKLIPIFPATSYSKENVNLLLGLYLLYTFKDTDSKVTSLVEFTAMFHATPLFKMVQRALELSTGHLPPMFSMRVELF